jgi:hypothetical protein
MTAGLDPAGAAQELVRLVAEHERWRASCLNLVAAENVMSPQARALLASDLASRYGDYVGRDLRARKYFGTTVMVEIEAHVEELLRRLFDAEFVEARPLSGHVAGVGAVLALTEPGELVLELDSPGGGHRIAEKLNATHHAQLECCRCRSIRRRTPSASANGRARALPPSDDHPRQQPVPLPHPLARLAAAVPINETLIARRLARPRVDRRTPLPGSAPGGRRAHVGIDPQDLPGAARRARADAVGGDHRARRAGDLSGARHEPQPGPDAVAGPRRRRDARLRRGIRGRDPRERPGARSRDRPARSAGRSRAGLHELHTLLLPVAAFGPAREVGARLESAGIITTATRLPSTLGEAGIRLGLQEVTRRGATPEDMPAIADAIVDVLTGRQTLETVRGRTRELAARLGRIEFCFDAVEAPTTS